jgi:hypothetical protein
MKQETITLELSERFLQSYADNKARQEFLMAQSEAQGFTRNPVELAMMKTLPIVLAALEDAVAGKLDTDKARAEAIHALPLYIVNLVGTILMSHIQADQVDAIGCVLFNKAHELWHKGKKVHLVEPTEQ